MFFLRPSLQYSITPPLSLDLILGLLLARLGTGLSRVCSRVHHAKNPMFMRLVTGVTGKTPPGYPPRLLTLQRLGHDGQPSEPIRA
jgi:hypothetical protein